MLDKDLVKDIITGFKRHAPLKAKVILRHSDGRVFFAEKFEQGVTFWGANGGDPRELQGIIHKLELVAKRNDQGDWVGIHDLNGTPAPTGRKLNALKHQTALSNRPKVTPAVSVSKADPVVEPLKVKLSPVAPQLTQIRLADFVSIRDLESPEVRRCVHEPFISFRMNGKIILNKLLRETLGDMEFSMSINKDFDTVLLIPGGTGYHTNGSGCYSNKTLAAKLKFPDDRATLRALLTWNETLKGYMGKIQ